MERKDVVVNRSFGFSQNEIATYALTKGHSTTASMRVSKTLDRGSIPRAPAIKAHYQLTVCIETL